MPFREKGGEEGFTSNSPLSVGCGYHLPVTMHPQSNVLQAPSKPPGSQGATTEDRSATPFRCMGTENNVITRPSCSAPHQDLLQLLHLESLRTQKAGASWRPEARGWGVSPEPQSLRLLSQINPGLPPVPSNRTRIVLHFLTALD